MDQRTDNGSIPQLTACSFDNLKGWEADDHKSAFDAFCVSAKRMAEKPYKTRALGIDGQALANVAQDALALQNVDGLKARQFFETHFQPHSVGQENSGFLTGYFEPLVGASLTPSADFPVPLLRRPDDLIDVNDDNRPFSLSPDVRYGRFGDTGIEAYFDRESIQSGALEGCGLELVWLRNKVDAFFIHVQGSAKLVLPNGTFMRVTYAAKSGHAYSSVAKVLCAQIDVAPEEMTADRLADWMHGNPDEIDNLLAHNKSYIFFEEVTELNPEDGPLAAAKTSLIEGRSLAVDRTLHTFGTPIWLSTKKPLPKDEQPLARLMIAQDTGSAITGSARGDIFIGTGTDAGLIAGRVRHETSMVVFVPIVKSESLL